VVFALKTSVTISFSVNVKTAWRMLSQVADGEDSLQILGVAANIFNKQMRTADKRRFSVLRVCSCA
jgi:hypothetical protein